MAKALYNLCKKNGTVMEYSITGSEVTELISCKKQDVYNSASYGQMIRKEFYVEVVDRPLSRTKGLTLLLEYDRVCREILERSEDVLVMIQQLQDDLKKDERPKLTKIEKCFVESLNDKWDYLCRNSNGELEAVKRTFTLFAVNSESLNLKDVTKAKFDFIADDGRRWLISELKEFEVEV